MAAFYGFPEEGTVTPEAARAGDVIIVNSHATLLGDGLDVDYRDESMTLLTPQGKGYVLSPRQWWAFDAHDFGEENLFNRIWITPTAIDFGFVTEVDSATFEIWNAWLRRAVTVTSRTTTGNATGFTLTAAATPFDIAPMGLNTSTVQIELDGPSQQDTTFVMIIDGAQYTVDITATRTLTFTSEPDWGRGLEFGYTFQTIVFTNPYFVEQRRPAAPCSWRRSRLLFLVNGAIAQDLFNTFIYGHDKVFCVPIYQERMDPVTLTAGTKTITLAASTASLWNLNNRATHVMLVDHALGVAEVKAIDTIAAMTITTDEAIVATFDPDATTVYPIYFGILHAVKLDPATDTTSLLSAEFREYIDG